MTEWLRQKDHAIIHMIEEFLGRYQDYITVATYNFFIELRQVAMTMEEGTNFVDKEAIIPREKISGPISDEALNKIIIISCDASIKKNPGGPSSVGVVIQIPGKEKVLEIAQVTKSTTNNQAEYDAVYTGLLTLINLMNRPAYPIEVRSDSQLIIKQLRKEQICKDEKLQMKRDIILELVSQIPQTVIFCWRPRNSTPELKQANHLAQDKINVPRH